MFGQLPLPVNVGLFLAAAAVVWFCGVRLARLADAIARRTGIGRDFLGLLLLGGVTSLPELAIATTATLHGEPVLSINDVLGSAAINVVILALADAAIGRGALTSMQGSPGVMLQGVLGIVLMAITVAAVVVGDRLLFGVGAWSWTMLIVYVASLRLLAKSHAARAWRAISAVDGRERGAEDDQGEHRTPARLAWLTALVAGGIVGAGFVLARSGSTLAEQTGIGTSFFGAVFLGLSTSLPEMSTVLAAVRMRQYEMAISDVFGTNLFNVTIIVLVDALHPGGPVLVDAGPFAAFAALLALVLTALYIAGMIERRDRTVLRMGVDSLMALCVYASGVVVLYQLR